MNTTNQTRRGFAVRCLHCGGSEGVRLDLADLDTFSCSECNEEFDVADVRSAIEEWKSVLNWIDLAPESEKQT